MTLPPLTRGAALIDLLRVGLVSPEPKRFLVDQGLFACTDSEVIDFEAWERQQPLAQLRQARESRRTP